MKALFAVLLMFSSFSAHALESHYGKLKNSGFKYTCSLYNKTNHVLDMKYVIFSLARSSGENPDFDVQVRIDRTVSPGKTLTYSVSEPQAWSGNHCRFLAR